MHELDYSINYSDLLIHDLNNCQNIVISNSPILLNALLILTLFMILIFILFEFKLRLKYENYKSKFVSELRKFINQK